MCIQTHITALHDAHHSHEMGKVLSEVNELHPIIWQNGPRRPKVMIQTSYLMFTNARSQISAITCHTSTRRRRKLKLIHDHWYSMNLRQRSNTWKLTPLTKYWRCTNLIKLLSTMGYKILWSPTNLRSVETIQLKVIDGPWPRWTLWQHLSKTFTLLHPRIMSEPHGRSKRRRIGISARS